jgi:hypothetical protein
MILLLLALTAQDPRLARLDPETRVVVTGVVDSAQRAGLPPEPLVQRALEGVAKGASGERITAAVRRLAADLGSARGALGASASVPEIEAGAAALRAGASPDVLRRLRGVRRPPLTMALAVVADLVAGGVPSDSAASAVLVLAPTARDADLVEFRRAVERDIALGASPASAASSAASVRVNAGARTASPGRP